MSSRLPASHLIGRAVLIQIVALHGAGRTAVLAHLPAELMAKLRDLHARGVPIESDPAFFHFGGGMAVRNPCRERLSDKELAAYCLFGDWDGCYIGVLVEIAAMRQYSMAFLVQDAHFRAPAIPV